MVCSAVPAVAEQDKEKYITSRKKESVQQVDEENQKEMKEAEIVEVELDGTEVVSDAIYSPSDMLCQGVVYYNGYRWTYYSERVLPGPGLNIPGRHTDEDGYVCDEDDFICVASQDLAKGTEVDTPFGKRGKVYDWCGISGTIDIYVNW